MFRICFIILVGFSPYSLGREELTVLHSPSSVKFSGNEPLRSSILSDLFSAIFSYTLPKQEQWPNLEPVNPFHRPEALFIMHIIGFDDDMDLNLPGNHFLLENMGDIDYQYNILKYRTNNRYTYKKPVLIKFDANENLYSTISEYPLLLKDLPPNQEKRIKLIKSDVELNQCLKDQTFNISVPNDIQLLKELATVKALVNSVSKSKSKIVDAVPDIYWIKLTGLQNLIEDHGINSYQVSEGTRLLRQTILEIIPILKAMYDDLIMIAGITENSESQTLLRRTRNLLAADMSYESRELNLAEIWSPDFPVAFAIISFLAIIMILSVLGISIAIWNMDPGRDSIMTGQRTKKD